MLSQLHSYAVNGNAFDALVVRPEDDRPRPVVLIAHAWGGRSEFEESKARALAELGYVGAAIDVYGVGRRGRSKEENAALMGEATRDPSLLRARLQGALEAVRGVPGVDESRAGVIGFCFGGLCALLMARMGLPLRGAVSFHGLLKIGDSLETRPVARMLVCHGQDDPMAPPEDVGRFATEMQRIGGDWELHAYPGVVHAFTNPAAQDPAFGTVYDAEADRRSWAAMRRFLGEVFEEGEADR